MKIVKLKVKNFTNGFTLVEAIIVSAIAASFIVALSFVNTSYLNYAFGESNVLGANSLAIESLEAVRFMRDKSWTANIAPLTAGQEYFLYFNGISWSATTTVQTPSPFWRTFRINNVYRDAGDNISASGNLDSGTKLVTTSVSWAVKGATTTKTMQTYITNLFNN